MSDFVAELAAVLQDRKANPNATSYTSELLTAGMEKIAQKVGEEGVELAIAGLAQSDERVLDESADLIYHMLVLLTARDLTWDDVQETLAKRHK